MALLHSRIGVSLNASVCLCARIDCWYQFPHPYHLEDWPFAENKSARVRKIRAHAAFMDSRRRASNNEIKSGVSPNDLCALPRNPREMCTQREIQKENMAARPPKRGKISFIFNWVWNSKRGIGKDCTNGMICYSCYLSRSLRTIQRFLLRH